MSQDEKRTNEMFYKNLFENVYKYIYFRVGNKYDAEDITSETVARIIEKKDLSEVQNINFFAIGIARNVMADHFNKNKKLNTGSASLDDMTEVEFADDISLDETVLNDEMIELIKKELINLDELTAEIIVLRVWQNMQFSEIAGITSLKEMAVKQRFYRGVDTLKMSLNKPQKSYKAYSFTLPIILAGAKVLFTTSEFAAAGSFITGLVSGITKLNIILPTMTIGTTAVTKTAGGILSSTAAKVIAVVVGTGTIVGGGFVVANVAAPDSDANPINKTTVENVVSKAGTEVEKVEETTPDCMEKEYKNPKFRNFRFKYSPCEWKLEESVIHDGWGGSGEYPQLDLTNLKNNAKVTLFVSRQNLAMYTGNMQFICSTNYKLLKPGNQYGYAGGTDEGPSYENGILRVQYSSPEKEIWEYSYRSQYFEKLSTPEQDYCSTNFGVLNILEPEDGASNGTPSGKLVSAGAYIPGGLNLNESQLSSIDEFVKTLEIDN